MKTPIKSKLPAHPPNTNNKPDAAPYGTRACHDLRLLMLGASVFAARKNFRAERPNRHAEYPSRGKNARISAKAIRVARVRERDVDDNRSHMRHRNERNFSAACENYG
jgi:hypothetical protein